MFRKNAKQKTAEGRVFSPYTAERSRFCREQPDRGAAGMPLRETLDKSDKFAWSKFEEPIGWPAGRKPWMVFVKVQESGGIGAAFSLVSFFSTAGMQEIEQCMEQLPRPRKRKKLGCRAESRL
ncbi:MAG: hypothetical protein PHH11_08480 [Methylomonas sp.]|nr:hypothetical protein [Methylomonas sp.]